MKPFWSLSETFLKPFSLCKVALGFPGFVRTTILWWLNWASLLWLPGWNGCTILISYPTFFYFRLAFCYFLYALLCCRFWSPNRPRIIMANVIVSRRWGTKLGWVESTHGEKLNVDIRWNNVSLLKMWRCGSFFAVWLRWLLVLHRFPCRTGKRNMSRQQTCSRLAMFCCIQHWPTKHGYQIVSSWFIMFNPFGPEAIFLS